MLNQKRNINKINHENQSVLLLYFAKNENFFLLVRHRNILRQIINQFSFKRTAKK